MSVIEPVPYRPWCEGQQDSPVDFSLKNRGRRTSESSDIRSQLFVRTPDSGFSSPSENEFVRRQQITAQISHLFLPSPSDLSSEQIAPLALVKKDRVRESDSEPTERSSPISTKKDFLASPGSSPTSHETLLSQASSFHHILSSPLYWQHPGSSPTSGHPSFTALVKSAYDLSKAQNLHEMSLNQTQSTPVRSPPRSPVGECSIFSPIKRKTSPANVTPEKKTKSVKKTKASRRLNFDEDKTSPVSGTIIRELEEGEEPLVVRKGDIDPAYNVVEITDEAKAELSKIDNKIGDYVCRLCKELYDDAFGLAQHRCSRIIHVEYRCPECDKVFNCPANLASHRRWHKPKGTILLSSAGPKVARGQSEGNRHSNSKGSSSKSGLPEAPELIPISELTSLSDDNSIMERNECEICFKKFKKQSYLRKHLLTHSEGESRDHDSSNFSSHVSHYGSAPHLLYSPQSPPIPPIPSLLSPFSETVFRCRLCSATFFTPTALQLHYSSIHDADDSLSASSHILSNALTMPMSPFSPKSGLLSPPLRSDYYSLLNRSPQIRASS